MRLLLYLVCAAAKHVARIRRLRKLLTPTICHS